MVLTDAEWAQLQRKLRLTDRELEVLRCLFEEQPDEAIARSLDISQSTVRAHLMKLFRKCKCRTRTGVVASAFRAYVDVRDK